MATYVRAVASGLQPNANAEAIKMLAVGCVRLGEVMVVKGRPVPHRQALVAETAGGAILQALAAYPANVQVQCVALQALSCMTARNSAACAAVSGHGVNHLLASMGNHGASASVQRRACNLALQLSVYGSAEVCAALAQAGAVQALVAALQAHGADGGAFSLLAPHFCV